jgi:hypothetical protein
LTDAQVLTQQSEGWHPETEQTRDAGLGSAGWPVGQVIVAHVGRQQTWLEQLLPHSFWAAAALAVQPVVHWNWPQVGVGGGQQSDVPQTEHGVSVKGVLP